MFEAEQAAAARAANASAIALLAANASGANLSAVNSTGTFDFNFDEGLPTAIPSTVFISVSVVTVCAHAAIRCNPGPAPV